MIVAVDFAPGLHGHFLELIINKYIFGIPYNKEAVFQSSGAVHVINTDQDYQSTKLANCGHYSSFGYAYPQDVQKIVFIKHAPVFDIVLLTNIFHRCHPDAVSVDDFNFKEILSVHENTMALNNSNSDIDFRKDWFSKLTERHFELTDCRPVTELPVFDFDYSTFFNLPDFCNELKRTSKFLNSTFLFDESLVDLWYDFKQRNQGWQLYTQAQDLLTKTLSGVDAPIPDDWKIHAYLNYQVGKLFELYDGELHTNPAYPTTTTQLSNIIKQHVKNFDQTF
jgi:hypothetical protein